MRETVLDVQGLTCPLPVLKANKALRGLAPGARLTVLATDPASVRDFQAYARETGHALVGFSEGAGLYRFTLRKRDADPRDVVATVATGADAAGADAPRADAPGTDPAGANPGGAAAIGAGTAATTPGGAPRPGPAPVGSGAKLAAPPATAPPPPDPPARR